MTLDAPQDFLDQSLEEDKSVMLSTQRSCSLYQSNRACHRSSNNFKTRQVSVFGQAALIRGQMGR